ncbi:hypothetical protein LSAT2_016407 [Lamellibrachia satsuma]|nr:hypothetical protein LSAT2_016407 [Lamellibrachia satsuma]
MRTLLLVVCGAAAAVAWCSLDDANVVYAHWIHMTSVGRSGDKRLFIAPTAYFFVRLINKYPEAKSLFDRVNVDDIHSPEFQAHSLRVAISVDICITSLKNPRLLEEITSHLAKQHATRIGVIAAYFELFRRQIRDHMLSSSDKFPIDAWDNCFTPIINAMSARLP